MGWILRGMCNKRLKVKRINGDFVWINFGNFLCYFWGIFFVIFCYMI